MNCIKLSVIALSLIFSGYVSAESRPVVVINKEDLKERRQSFENATNVIGILTSEIILQKGNPKGALIGYLTMLERSQDGEVANRAFELALVMEDVATAQKILDMWKQFEPKMSIKQKQAQWKLDLLGNKAAAWSNLESAFESMDEMDVPRAFYVLASFAGTREKAAKNDYNTIRKIAKKYPNMPEAEFCLGAFAYEAKNKVNMALHLRRLAVLVPEPTPEIEYFLAVLLKARPDYLEEFYKKADENLSVGWGQYQIDLLVEKGKTQEAYQEIQRLLQKDSSRPTLYLQAGYLAQKLKKPTEESLALYEKAYQLGGATQSRAILLIGALYYDTKNIEEATKWFNKISDEASLFDRNLFLAWIAIDKKETQKAQKLISEAKKTHGKSSFFSLVDLDDAQLAIYRIDKKEKEFILSINKMIKEATTEKRKNELLLNRSFFQSDIIGKPELAIDTLRNLLSQDPENIDYLNSLGYTLLIIKGHEQEAYTLIKKAHDKEPESAAINDSLGWVLFKLDKAEEALPYLEYAFTNMLNAEVAAHLGEVLWHLGRQEEAKAIWQQGMDEDQNDKILLETRKRFGVK